MQNHNNYIHSLITNGLSVIPVADGAKKPHRILGPSHDLLTRRATPDEVDTWLAADVTSWGVAGGEVSRNLVTLDFDEKHYPGLFDMCYAKLSNDQKEVVDTCYKNSTRNDGTHLRYRTQTSQPTIKLARRVEYSTETQKEEIVTTAEVRGEGAYALIPPSDGYKTIQGSLLDLPLVTDEMHEEFIDILRTFNEVEDEPATEYEWKATDISPTDRPGDRLNKLSSWNEILEPHGWVEESKDRWRRPGKDKGEGISATTNYDDHPMLYVFSTSASPFEANKGYSKFRVFALLNHGGGYKAAAKAAATMYPSTEISTKQHDQTEAKSLIESIMDREDVVLFHDDKGNGYISFEISGHRESWSCKGRDIKRWLSHQVWVKNKKPVTPDMMKNILSVLEANACHEGMEHKLHNRVAWRNGELWYDLADPDWQAVKIGSQGWEVMNTPPILFKRYSHHKAQVLPQKNGDPGLFLKYINITNEQHKLLLMVFLVSCFIPDFPHPILIVFGSHGGGKSTLSKLLRSTNDPSVIDVIRMPDNHKELIQTLSHHHFLFFDNVSYISESASDDLCGAITGSAFSKRELYTDDDDIIYNLMNCIGINGINLVATRPDLLDRSMLIELERVDEENKKSEEDIYAAFQADLPSILGGVFDVIVKAINIKPGITADRLPRMVDFALWGCAIAEALGYTKEDFLTAYDINIVRQTEMLLNDNVVATAIVTFMDGKDDWRGTPTQLLNQLDSHASLTGIDTWEKYWPKGANALSRKLNELSTPLKKMGYSVVISTTGIERFIQIRKVLKNTPTPATLSATPLQLPLNDSVDDTDDIPR